MAVELVTAISGPHTDTYEIVLDPILNIVYFL